MAEDDDISRRYRELPREEPPRHLDEAIRAAARRAVHTRPAPLVVPTGRQRWYFPLAAAAIIVLAVAVTMQVEREQPGEEIATAPAARDAPASTREFKREEAQAPAEMSKPAPQPERRRKTESAGAPAAPAPPIAGASPAPAQRADEAARTSSALAKLAERSPEQWLQGIAELRRQGRHEEAEQALAEFRKRYPDYRISKEVLEQVEKR